ncbi:SRPBCC domain-containing protein [Paraflavitalea speifideaquila]|uniref:SRPBCC family protein n=1 Tax=Paraflavitalea speifideaquila TaxID=3076558 RepID=UPI0028E18D30|nr:SRPBCC domain-containing protein [Paraflavitalea speifideiaquila]
MEKSINKSIEINTAASKVWNALINPDIITQFLPGVEVITDWKVGSELIFVYDQAGNQVRDKGIILDFVPTHLLRYTYWTPYSGLEDHPEHYTTITYSLSEENNKTLLTVNQINFNCEQWWQNSLAGWDDVLATIKEIVER